MELAQLLHIESLTDARATALRREALTLIDRLPPPSRQLRSTTRWRPRVAAVA